MQLWYLLLNTHFAGDFGKLNKNRHLINKKESFKDPEEPHSRAPPTYSHFEFRTG